ARQVAEFGRRLAAVEGRMVSANSTGADRIQGVANEIGELGGLVRQIAASVANHDDMLTVLRASHKAAAEQNRSGGDAPHVAAAPDEEKHTPSPPPPPPGTEPSRSHASVLAAIRNAVDENRIDIYLQPMVTLPQRKVRFYEAMTRLRDDKDQVLAAEDF